MRKSANSYKKPQPRKVAKPKPKSGRAKPSVKRTGRRQAEKRPPPKQAPAKAFFENALVWSMVDGTMVNVAYGKKIAVVGLSVTQYRHTGSYGGIVLEPVAPIEVKDGSFLWSSTLAEYLKVVNSGSTWKAVSESLMRNGWFMLTPDGIVSVDDRFSNDSKAN